MSQGSRAVTGFGLLLVVGGVAVLGWLAWQMWGTSWQSQQRHDDLASQVQDAWRDDQPSFRSEYGKVTAVVHIEKFGKDYAVPVLPGASDEVLASGFGKLKGSADAGDRGNLVLAGHRVTHGEPLADMPELQPGDEVVVETADQVHTYRLDTGGDDLRVDFTQTWVADPRPRNPVADGVEPVRNKKLLTLVTCAELFHTDDRLVAFGHLVDSRPR